MRRTQSSRGFTIVEMIVSTLAAAVVLIVTLAMTQDARDKAMVTQSTTNLRMLAVATATYAAEWNDRQFTLVADDLGALGKTMKDALANYAQKHGAPHPPIVLGERTNAAGERVQSVLDMNIAAQQRWLQPISFDAAPDGSFRAVNVSNFNQYLDGRFFSRIFYAPKDTVVMDVVRSALRAATDEAPTGDGDLYWSSYSRSPSAMYHWEVLAAPQDPRLPQRAGASPGFHDPFSIARGFRSPAMSQALYPNLKTDLIEHHWLQNRPAWATDCNEAIEDGRYRGCEPHSFNHYAFSQPVCGFFDGHIEAIRVADVLDGDARVREQSGFGLWHDHPGGATDGYFQSMALDPTRTSFHIFTTNGIRGRDVTR